MKNISKLFVIMLTSTVSFWPMAFATNGSQLAQIIACHKSLEAILPERSQGILHHQGISVVRGLAANKVYILKENQDTLKAEAFEVQVKTDYEIHHYNIQFPDGEYCLAYDQNWILDDEVHFFSKKTQQSCSEILEQKTNKSITPSQARAHANEAEANKVFLRKLQNVVQREALFYQKKSSKDSAEYQNKMQLIHTWSPDTCHALKDNKINVSIKLLKQIAAVEVQTPAGPPSGDLNKNKSFDSSPGTR